MAEKSTDNTLSPSMDYQKAYALLVGTISDAVDEIDKAQVISQELENAKRMLKGGLEKAEEMYICSDGDFEG